MKKVVIMPGGFHPFHAGHLALYKSAVKKFPDADVYVAASDSQTARPFPFKVKETLATLAGIPKGRFVQVKSPFRPEEITRHYDAAEDALIFVRSEKDRNESPKPGGTKKDGSPAYYRVYDEKNLRPFNEAGYIEYLPTIQFAGGITSASEIRNSWPKLDELGKIEMIRSMYPDSPLKVPAVKKLVQMLDTVLLGEVVTESLVFDPQNKEELLETLGQLNEVNLKKLAATIGLLGTLITPVMAQAYDNGDLQKMGFSGYESRSILAMPPQDRATKINAQIEKIGGSNTYGHGQHYTFPKVTADTVDQQRPGLNGGRAKMDRKKGSGDPQTLRRNARLLSQALSAYSWADKYGEHKGITQYIKKVYYSSKINKIVIVPQYPNYGWKARKSLHKVLGDHFIDNIAKTMIVPAIVKAVTKVGVPLNVNMDNIIIVDRHSRAIQMEAFVSPEQSKQYWNHDAQLVGVGGEIQMPLRDTDRRGRRQGYNESIDKIRSMITETPDEQKEKAIDLHHKLFALMEEEKNKNVFQAPVNEGRDEINYKDAVAKLHIKTVELKEYFEGWRDTSAPRVLRKEEPQLSKFDFWNKIDLSETADYIEEK